MQCMLSDATYAVSVQVHIVVFFVIGDMQNRADQHSYVCIAQTQRQARQQICA